MRQVALRNTAHDAVKMAIAFAVNGSGDPDLRSWAVNRWTEAGAPTEITKAADAVLTADVDSVTSTGLLDRELFRAVREKALLFRMRGVRRTGFNVRSTTISNSQAQFVGEAKPIIALKPTITNVGLDPAKVAGMSVWTKEALESSPGIEALVFDDLVRAVSDALDFAMFDPANDGTDIAPASLTYGTTAIASTGDLDADLAEVFAAFSGDLTRAVFVTTPQIGAGLAGEFTGRDIGARGGELAGVPVLTSAAAPDAQLTLVDPGSIMAAWDEMIELQTSEAGTVELSSSPSQDPPTGAALVSLWQNNLRSIRAIGRFAWAGAGPSTAVSITGLFPDAS